MAMVVPPVGKSNSTPAAKIVNAGIFVRALDETPRNLGYRQSLAPAPVQGRLMR
jgi:hypothetical protein